MNGLKEKHCTHTLFFPLSFIHSRWWKAYSGLLYFWTDLKTDYTTALISPESQSILDVRAALTNECEALSYSLFVITTVTSAALIWIEAICFPFASLPVVGSTCPRGMFTLSTFTNEAWGKVQEGFFPSVNINLSPLTAGHICKFPVIFTPSPQR